MCVVCSFYLFFHLHSISLYLPLHRSHLSDFVDDSALHCYAKQSQLITYWFTPIMARSSLLRACVVLNWKLKCHNKSLGALFFPQLFDLLWFDTPDGIRWHPINWVWLCTSRLKMISLKFAIFDSWMTITMTLILWHSISSRQLAQTPNKIKWDQHLFSLKLSSSNRFLSFFHWRCRREGGDEYHFPFYLFANDMTYANDVNVSVCWQSS